MVKCASFMCIVDNHEQVVIAKVHKQLCLLAVPIAKGGWLAIQHALNHNYYHTIKRFLVC